ncbi:MAG: hypothetical protein FWF27_01020 [Candidatus Bathyarchaeota archaeon]|nr:hypothetical protein [Candidatus Termiticorpusculum sp.]
MKKIYFDSDTLSDSDYTKVQVMGSQFYYGDIASGLMMRIIFNKKLRAKRTKFKEKRGLLKEIKKIDDSINYNLYLLGFKNNKIYRYIKSKQKIFYKDKRKLRLVKNRKELIL